jgi:hypothetical protein
LIQEFFEQQKREREFSRSLSFYVQWYRAFALVLFGNLVFACNVVDHVACGIGLALVRPFASGSQALFLEVMA